MKKLWVAFRTRKPHSRYPKQCDACSYYCGLCRTCEFRDKVKWWRTAA